MLRETQRKWNEFRQTAQGQGISALADLLQEHQIASRVCAPGFGLNRFGTAYHDRLCNFCRPPHSRTAAFARVFSVCAHKDVWGVL